MPRAFSWEQLGIAVLLAAVLVGLYAWREHPAAAPAAPQPEPVFIEITGEGAAHPGVYAFDHPPTLLQALEKAGAPSPGAPANPVLASGTLVEVDKHGRYQLRRMAGPRLLALGLPLDLNQATAEELERLPGLGPELARRIVEYRQQHGAFKRLEDLAEVKGVGPKKFTHLKTHLTVDRQGAVARPR